MGQRNEPHHKKRIWTVAVRVGDDALRARLISELDASAEVELAPEAKAETADVSVIDAALGQPLRGATVLLTNDARLIHTAVAVGVATILPTNVTRAALLAAIEATARGLAVVERGLLSRLLHEGSWPLQQGSSADELTGREREVLTLLAQGASNKIIARHLGVSIHTVKYHVASILEKLDATGRTDAVAHAVRLGLILL